MSMEFLVGTSLRNNLYNLKVEDTFRKVLKNIDVNIALANKRLCELYGDDFCVISRYSLENNGWGGNSFFFEIAPTLTYSMLLEIENSSSPITDK